MFRMISRSNRILLWLNNLFLMTVSFIPFPASLIALYGNQRPAVILYCASIITAAAALYVLWAYASSRGRLLHAGVSSRVIRIAGWRILGGASFYVVAILVSFVYLSVSRAFWC